MEDKYHQAVAESHVLADDDQVRQAVEKILADHLEENLNEQAYRQMFSCIDLTTLKSTDSPRSVADFTERVNAFEEQHPDIKPVAAVCVYPNFAQVVRTVLEVSEVDIACVSGGFPSAQTFPEVKIAETALAVSGGADEIDIVMNLGNFLDGDWEEVCDEISELKAATGDGLLKVILETGALRTAQRIKEASVLAMYSGADFIKTSTGKEYPGASLEAAYVMLQCIKEYHQKTSRRVGFKAAGGVRTPREAACYYTLVKEVLGQDWLTKDTFRIGASSLADNLLSAILGEETHAF